MTHGLIYGFLISVLVIHASSLHGDLCQTGGQFQYTVSPLTDMP